MKKQSRKVLAIAVAVVLIAAGAVYVFRNRIFADTPEDTPPSSDGSENPGAFNHRFSPGDAIYSSGEKVSLEDGAPEDAEPGDSATTAAVKELKPEVQAAYERIKLTQPAYSDPNLLKKLNEFNLYTASDQDRDFYLKYFDALNAEHESDAYDSLYDINSDLGDLYAYMERGNYSSEGFNKVWTVARQERIKAIQDQAEYDASADAKESARKYSLSYYKPSVQMNPETGRVEYRTPILFPLPGDEGKVGGRKVVEGMVTFDPIAQTYSANILTKYAGRNIRLVSDQLTGYVYATFSNADQTALVKQGGVSLMEVEVSKDGKFGGTFEYANRLFKFDSRTQAFAIPITIGSTGKIGFAEKPKTADLGTIYLDTKGNVNGKVDLTKPLGIKTGQAGLYFSTDGDISLGYSIPDAAGRELGTININKDGEIAGSFDVARAFRLGGSVIFGFDSHGINSVFVPFNLGGSALGFGIARNGAISITGVMNLITGLGGIGNFLVNSLLGQFIKPVGIGQDAHGNFQLSWPGGSLKLFGNEKRPLSPPKVATDADEQMLMDHLYFRHSFKKGLQTVRVYQDKNPETIIEKPEQIERANKIFEKYNELLGRNPSPDEFLNWYFYGMHYLYKFPAHQEEEYRMSSLEEYLQKCITGKDCYYKGNDIYKKKEDNKKEYQWITSGKSPLEAPTRPEEIMEFNPFSEEMLSKSAETDKSGTQIQPFKELEGKLLEQARADKEASGVKQDDSIETGKIGECVSFDAPAGFKELIPLGGAVLDVGVFNAKGITVFEYDTASKKWLSNISQIKNNGKGYYLKNPTQSSISTPNCYREADVEPYVVQKGWNLLSQCLQSPQKLDQIKVKAVKKGWSDVCATVACAEDVTLKQLLEGGAQNARAYGKLFIPDAQKKENVFETLDVGAGGVDAVLFPSSCHDYWLYLFE